MLGHGTTLRQYSPVYPIAHAQLLLRLVGSLVHVPRLRQLRTQRFVVFSSTWTSWKQPFCSLQPPTRMARFWSTRVNVMPSRADGPEPTWSTLFHRPDRMFSAVVSL